MNICAKCGKTINYIKAAIASRMFPISCAHCGSKNFRNHSIFYYLSTILFSIGLLALIFISMSHGFALSGKFLLGYILVLLGVYLGEIFFQPLEKYTPEEKEKDHASGRYKAIAAIVIILVSVVFYLYESTGGAQ